MLTLNLRNVVIERESSKNWVKDVMDQESK